MLPCENITGRGILRYTLSSSGFRDEPLVN